MDIKRKPSRGALDRLVEEGKSRIDIISWRPFDLPDCACEKTINDCIVNKKTKHIVCPNAKNKKQYKIVCKNCGEQLAYFHADAPILKDYCNLHTVSWYNKDSWHGCYGINRNPQTLIVNFECCCGSKVIRESSEVKIKGLTGLQKVKNIKRYTEYKII